MAKQQSSTTTVQFPLVESGSKNSFIERGFTSLGVIDVPMLNVSCEAFVEVRQYQGTEERLLHLAMPRAHTLQLVQLSALKRATQNAAARTMPGKAPNPHVVESNYESLMDQYLKVWSAPASEDRPAIARDMSEGFILEVDGRRWFLREGWSAYTPTFSGESTADEYAAKRAFRRQARQSSLATVSMKPSTVIDDFAC